MQFYVLALNGLLKALFGSLEGKVWEKMNEQVEEIEENGRGGFWGVNFSS